MKNQTRGRVLPAVPVSRETPRGPIRGETRRPVSGRLLEVMEMEISQI